MSDTMIDRESVIRQLTQHIARADYIETDWMDCVSVPMLRGALALLKEQEPMVLTLEEANAVLQKDDVIWIEEEDGHMFGGIRKEDYFEMQDGSLVDFDDLMEPEIANKYGKVYRMWSSKPTEEQRKAVKWDD